MELNNIFFAMRKLITLFVLIALVVITSCEEYDGKWRPMKVDKQHLNFTAEGGEQSVTLLNYSRWWISGGYESYDPTNGGYTNYLYPTSTGGMDFYTYDLLDGGWYHVVVPNNGQSNIIVITVDKNETGQVRQATIVMTGGNVGTKIQISQRES